MGLRRGENQNGVSKTSRIPSSERVRVSEREYNNNYYRTATSLVIGHDNNNIVLYLVQCVAGVRRVVGDDTETAWPGERARKKKKTRTAENR